MGVVYIGDRATGKTALAMELIRPKWEYVHITSQNYESLRAILFDEEEQRYRPTDLDPVHTYTSRFLEVNVKLPAGPRQIPLDWIDTPGEVWRQSWQQENPQQWQNVLTTVQKSDGVLLVLPPYREIPTLKPDVDASEFPTVIQWGHRFARWVDFFRYDCPKVRHLVICMNKADLFCDLSREALELAYHPYNSRKNWYQRNAYVTARFFQPIREQITQINSYSSLTVRCFITSIYHRSLLELPWVYLASHLAN